MTVNVGEALSDWTGASQLTLSINESMISKSLALGKSGCVQEMCRGETRAYDGSIAKTGQTNADVVKHASKGISNLGR